jgi:hypothetical protein
MQNRLLARLRVLRGALLIVRSYRGRGHESLDSAQAASLLLAARRSSVVLGLLVACAARAAGYSVEVPHAVDAWRTGFVARQHGFHGRRPYYVADTAQFVPGPLGDRPAAVLLFTLEGVRTSGDFLQYVATFWRSGGNYLFCCVRKVGGTGQRELKDIAIDDDHVLLHGASYGPGDAPCCPSRPVTLRFGLRGRALVEVASGPR